MRSMRLCVAAFVCLVTAAWSQTATVTGTLKTGGAAGVPSNAFLRFELKGGGGNQCRYNGSAVIDMTKPFDLAVNASGVVSGTIYRNDSITCGSSTASNVWRTTWWRNGQSGPPCDVRITTSTFDATQPACLNVSPVPTAPTTDTTYARLDGANQPFTGNVAVSGTSTLNGVATATAGLSANGVATPQVYGARADVIKLTDCAITSGTAALVCPSATFVAADATNHKPLVIQASSGVALVTTISAFVSSTAVTLANNAVTTASSPSLTYYGTDDTAAIKSCVANGTAVGKRCMLNNGSTYMMSNTASTVVMNGTGVGGILDGAGTIVFAPTGTLTAGTNDRFLYIRSSEATPIQVAAGAIAKGATSFTANAAGDVASWVKGDWIVLTEKDAALGDVLYVDWMQVSSVAGATVNVITPFRMAFPNARTWNVSGTPAACTAAGPCGLSARKVTNITNATLRDFKLIVPNISSALAGIVTRDTRGVVMDNLTIDEASGDAVATYLDQGLRLNNVHWDTAVGAEIAGTVDFSISGLQSQQVGTALNAFIAPAATCLTIDLGSGFGTLSNSTCGPNSNVGIFLNGGVHDTTVTSNTVGWIKGSSLGGAIQCVACYRVVLSGNVLAGGDGSAVGVLFSDSGAYTVTVNSDSNQAIGNVVNGFPTNYSCSGTNQNDNCDDYSGVSVGLRTIRNAQMTGLVMGQTDNVLANGANNNISPTSVNGAQGTYIRITGPSGAFSISGFTGGVNGRILYVFNATTQQMTITNEATSTAANRITTLTGADVVLRAGTSYATFIYEGATSRWKLVATN